MTLMQTESKRKDALELMSNSDLAAPVCPGWNNTENLAPWRASGKSDAKHIGGKLGETLPENYWVPA